MNTKELWIAKDSDGAVHLFSEKPYLKEGNIYKFWTIKNPRGLIILLSDEIEISFEDSPKKIL